MATYDAGSVIVVDDKIELTKFSGGGPLNIMNLVRSVDIFESLNNYTLSADFHIAEGIELINNFPIAGEEYIELTIQTPTRKALKYKFFIESISESKSRDASNLKMYTLRGVTKDLLMNAFSVYSRRYRDMNYDAAVADVITNDLKSEKSLVTQESTEGKFDYVVNNVRPFQTIDLICERAVSAENKSSMFFFYEDNQGYHFTTFEKLITDRTPAAPGLVFSYDTATRDTEFHQLINVRNILSYETMKQGSSVQKVRDGAIRTQIREFDIMTGEYYKMEEYNNTSDYGSFKATDGANDMNTSAYNAFVAKKPGVTRMVFKDGLRPAMKHNENIHWKRGFADRLSQQSVRIRVYGDTDIRVGDVIQLDIPEITGAQNPKIQDYYSGNYVIFEMKHRMDKRPTGGFEHFMVFDLRKPHIKKALG